MDGLGAMYQAALARGPRRVAVAGGDAAEVLLALADAKAAGLVGVTLFGDQGRLMTTASECGYDLAGDEVYQTGSAVDTARAAVAAVRSGACQLLMKGSLSTADLLRAVVDRDSGLRSGQLLSHIGIFEVPGIDRLLFLTDAGVNIAPGLAQKAAILQNAVTVAGQLGLTAPKVAALAAVEVVNPDMPATLEAAALALMGRRGQIRGAVIDGPLALDNAVFPEAAARKGISGPVAGRADVLLVPDIEAGNVAYKALLFFGHARAAGVVAGAVAPIITTSRAENHDTKLLSIALGVYLS